MAMAANSGVTRPAKATGTVIDVVAEGEREVLEDAPAGGAGEGQRVGAPGRGGRRARSGRRRCGWRRRREAGEIETWAAASAAASFRPSPTISTRRPCGAQRVELGDLVLRGGAGDPVGRCRGASARARTGASASPESSVTGRPAACRRRRSRRRPAGARRRSGRPPAAPSPTAEPGGGAGRRRRRRRPIRRGRGGRGAPARRPSVPRPGCSAMSVTGAGRMPASAAARGDGAGERVGAAGGERGGGGEGGGRGRAALVRRGLAGGQRAGLVEDDGVDLGEPLERGAVLEQHALRGTAGRRRRSSTAGTARPRPQGQVMISTAAAMLVARRQSPVREAPAERARRRRGRRRSARRARRRGRRGWRSGRGCARRPRRGGRSASSSVSSPSASARSSSGPVRFSMPARTVAPGATGSRHGLAGQQRGVDLGAARGDGAVGGDAGAGGDGDEVAGAERVERHGLAAAVGRQAVGDADLERGELGGGGAGGGAGAGARGSGRPAGRRSA